MTPADNASPNAHGNCSLPETCATRTRLKDRIAEEDRALGKFLSAGA